MAITMLQVLSALTGFVGCWVCLSAVRFIIALSACITAMGVTQETDEAMQTETLCLFIIFCIHLTSNLLFGRVAAGNIKYSVTADLIDWTCNLVEYILAIHVLTYFRELHQTNSEEEYLYNPKVVYNLLVTWITFDTILILFKIIVSLILYRKYKTRGQQKRYVIS
mmetsp:Transcript_44451/g.71197  ORF Transcript_44451/g.71197 Transcript_44451/m.71197 type:complete len:166 (+) Transcript_44451:80-577(+)